MPDATATLHDLEVDRLRYDPSNPRLPSNINGHDQGAVLAFMLREGNIVELMGSIGELGYFPGEPLLVVERKEEPGIFEVVEGNRRFTAAKLLRRPEMAPLRKSAVRIASESAEYHPDRLPCMVFQERGEILDFLGYRHITGIKPWDPLMKARYLRQLHARQPDATSAELARQIGSRTDYVERLRAALQAYEEIAENAFFQVPNLNERTLSFSVLTTALNYNNIAEFLGLDSGRDADLKGLDRRRLADLTRWLFEPSGERGKPRIPESRDLRIFSDVVADEEAREAFASGRASLDEAHRLTGARTDVYRQLVAEARDRLQSAQSHIHLVDDVEPRDLDTVVEIGRLVRDLRLLVQDRLLTQEEAL